MLERQHLLAPLPPLPERSTAMTRTKTPLGVWNPDWTAQQLRELDPLLPDATIAELTGEQGRREWGVWDVATALQVERQTVWKWCTARTKDVAAGRDPDINPLAAPAWLPDESPKQRNHFWYAGAWLWLAIQKGILYRDLTPVRPKPPGWQPFND
jgi:hypothetical protein